MSAYPEPKPTHAVRVAVVAAEEKRLRELVDLVAALGHEVVNVVGREPDEHEAGAADVVLADGDYAVTSRPVVTLGAADRKQAAALPRDASAEQLDAALRGVAAGLTVRPAESRKRFAAIDDNAPSVLLTPREVAILSAIAAGLGNKAIARSLDISLHTVKFHVESLLRKLNARTRAEAVAKGLARRVAETVEL